MGSHDHDSLLRYSVATPLECTMFSNYHVCKYNKVNNEQIKYLVELFCCENAYLPTVPFFPGLSRFLFPKNTEKRDCPVFHFSQQKKKKEKNNKNNKK